jgi:hypothetical protein
VSIAGVRVLSLLNAKADRFINAAVVRSQIGTTLQKLRADSPRRHEDGLRIPLLMLHGDDDA